MLSQLVVFLFIFVRSFAYRVLPSKRPLQIPLRERRTANDLFLRSSIKSSRFHTLKSVSRDIIEDEDVGLPRLHEDLDGLIRWIEKYGGTFGAGVEQATEGWSLVATNEASAGDVLIAVPKSLCIFANPKYMEMPLLENAQTLMSSLEPTQWRARLAIALLSERVRPSSFFRSYLRNLPFEFWGVPVFYDTEEFGLMQDLSLMQKTRDRCRFLGEFTESVLTPLRNTAQDPFSGHSADVNAFGWGFASAASRALRNPSVIGSEDGQVLVPGIDIANHHSDPSCEVVDDKENNCFILRALRDLSPGEALTIDYGPFSNDELLADYGFTIDNNPHDKIAVNCDAGLINTARMVMGQGNPEEAALTASNNNGNGNGNSSGNVNNNSGAAGSRAAAPAILPGMIGRGGTKLDERYLHQWQIYWLSALQLYGPKADTAMRIGFRGLAGIDPRLWAYLRVLYASREEDILRHGYTPFTLQTPGSVLSTKIEMQVLKTLVGAVGVMMRMYGSDIVTDIKALKHGLLEFDAKNDAMGGFSSMTSSSDDILSDVHKLLRNIFQRPHPLPLSPTVRRMISAGNLAAASTTDATIGTGDESLFPGSSQSTQNTASTRDNNSNINSNNSDRGTFKEGVASAQTPYMVAVGNSQSNDGASSNDSQWSPSAVIAGRKEDPFSSPVPVSPPVSSPPVASTPASSVSEADVADNVKAVSYLKSSMNRLSPRLDTAATPTADVSVEDMVREINNLPPADVVTGTGDGSSRSGVIDVTGSTSNSNAVSTSNPGTTSRSSNSNSNSNTGASSNNRQLPSEMTVDVNTLGRGLPINVREALRYRIRKKRSMSQLISVLGDAYVSLQQSSAGSHGPSSSSPSSLEGGGMEDILPAIASMDKHEKRAKIRDLVEEVRSRAPKEDILVTAKKISSKWSERGLDI